MKKDKFLLGVIALSVILLDFSFTKAASPQPTQEVGPFTGATSSDLIAVPPYPFFPLSEYAITLNSQNKKAYSSGENISFKGSLKFSPRQDKIFENRKACENNSQDYRIVNENDNSTVKQGKIDNSASCNLAFSYELPAVENVGIFVQVWRKDGNKATAENGDFLVDEFYATQNLTLKKDEPQNFELNWKIPQGAQGGNYYFSLFVDSNGKFPLKGLPVVYGDSAQTIAFTINKNDSNGLVTIDKDNIKINDIAYSQRVPSPTIDLGNQVILSIPLKNNSGVSQIAKIKYEISGWNQSNSANLIKSGEDVKNIDAGNTMDYVLPIDISDPSQSLYHIRTTVSSGDTKTIYNFHFVIKNRNRAMFTFFGSVKKVGEDSFSPIFCLKNKNWLGEFNGTVKIKAIDQGGKELGAWEKTGSIGTASSCFIVNDKKITFGQNDCLSLKGTLTDKDSNLLIDQGETTVCPKNEVDSSNTNSNGSHILSSKNSVGFFGNNVSGIIILLISILLIIIAISLFLIFKNNQKNEK